MHWDVIEAAVRSGWAKYDTAKVTTYRAILAERAALDALQPWFGDPPTSESTPRSATTSRIKQANREDITSSAPRVTGPTGAPILTESLPPTRRSVLDAAAAALRTGAIQLRNGRFWSGSFKSVEAARALCRRQTTVSTASARPDSLPTCNYSRLQ